jgi:hypothetical protein
MNEVQVKEIVRGIVREEFRQSLSEESYTFGKKSYTDKKLTPSEILDLANAYVNEPTTKLAGKTLGHRVYVANDLARLTGTIQMDVHTRSKQPALIVQLLKTGLLTKDEYVKLYTKLIKVQAEYIKTYLKKAAPEKRNQGAAMRAAEKDGRDSFNFENVNEMSQNDVHFKDILRMYDHGGSFSKKKVAVVVCKNPRASRKDIIDAMLDMDYNEITDVQDELGIKESVTENVIAKDGKVLSNGNLIGYYEFDRDADSFWVDDVKKGKGQLSFDTKKEVEDYFKKNEKDALKHLGKLRGESVNELKTLSNGNFKIKKQYNTFADYEKHAKIGDTILKYNKKSSMNDMISNDELHQNAKRYLNKVHSIGTDGVNVTIFGKQTPASIHPSDKKELAVVVLESIINEAKYDTYYKTYSAAIQAGLDWAKKSGYDYDEEEAAREIGMGPRKPSEGKTNKFHLSLRKDFKPQKKMLHIQVYGMKNSYELNAYIG